MKPYQKFRHTIAIKLDCEAHLCGRCYHKCMNIMGTAVCALYSEPLSLTSKGRVKRLKKCKDAEIASRPDGSTVAKKGGR